MSKRIIVLRPEAAAAVTVERSRELGLEALSIPLFELAPVEWEAPDPSAFEAIMFTSANAVQFAGEKLKAFASLPAHAVGNATAEAAKAAGFSVVTIGEKGVADMLSLLPPALKLFHPRGRDHVAVRQPNQIITPTIVYESRARDKVEGLEAVTGSVALLHSPRAGKRLSELVDEHGLDRSTIDIAAISLNSALGAGTGWRRLRVAEAPRDEALLALAARLCNNSAGE